MRWSVVSAALAAAFVLAPVAAGYAPALSQDFSITNEAPADAGRRDLMRQLQAWWDAHAYYPKEAAASDVDGTVKLHLVIHADGVIFLVYIDESSGSRSLDEAAFSTFSKGFVRPYPGAPDTTVDISAHYVLAHRHDQPAAAGYTQVASKRPFTISNEAVSPSVVDTMLQRTCTGTVVRRGIRNHPIYGWRNTAEAIFFRKPDGTPWVKFREIGVGGTGVKSVELGALVVTRVTEVGKSAKWTGQEERVPGGGDGGYATFTVWPEGDGRLVGDIEHPYGTVEFTCSEDVVPAITSTKGLEFAEPVQPAAVPEALHYRPGHAPPSFTKP